MKNNLVSFASAVLSREETKRITGGQRTAFACQCNGIGTWTANYETIQEMGDAISRNCGSNGGTCSNQNEVQ